MESVARQTYSHIQLIVIDNNSLDHSAKLIQQFIAAKPDTKFIKNEVNTGLCKAFNHALEFAEGKYIIDLSGDDILIDNRVEEQVQYFESLPKEFGAIFSNAGFINPDGVTIGEHFPVDAHGNTIIKIPEGEIFTDILRQYFICTPTLTFRKSILLKLGGYDENLSYEDFDILIRLSRNYKIGYQDKILTLKRLHNNSQSMQIIRKNNELLPSTLLICEKAYNLCRTNEELEVLGKRIRTFIRKCYYADYFELATQFSGLYNKTGKTDILTHLILVLCKQEFSINSLYVKYIKIRNLIKIN